MLDPQTVILVVGVTSTAGAAACGAGAVRAHLEQVFHEGVGTSLRRVFDDVANEPVPQEFRDLLNGLPEDTQ